MASLKIKFSLLIFPRFMNLVRTYKIIIFNNKRLLRIQMLIIQDYNKSKVLKVIEFKYLVSKHVIILETKQWIKTPYVTFVSSCCAKIWNEIKLSGQLYFHFRCGGMWNQFVFLLRSQWEEQHITFELI